jgi:hypothetical protein
VITVPAGTSVSDAATLSGPNSASASGTVGYAVYSDASCSTLYASGGTKTVTAGTTAPSDPVSFPQAGTYYWVASYSGDGLNNPSSSPCGSEVLTVTKPAAAHLSLSPKSATNPVDSPHTVTATVTDAAGNPVANVLVQFSVSGTDIRSGSCTTDSSGRCSFTYVVASMPGNDTIHAYADSNENGSQDASEPADDATKAIVLPASTAGCKVTYGGRITAANGDKATFGGNAQVPAKGQEQFVEHGPAVSNEFHSIDVQAVVCTGSSATIFGRGSLNRGPTQIYRIDVKDLGEPGRTDTYRLRIGAYDTSERPLDKGGNIQIHL